MHEAFLWNHFFSLFVSTVLSNKSCRTGKHFTPFFWVVNQHVSILFTKLFFESGKIFHSLEFTLSKSKLCVRRFSMQKQSHLWYWQIASFHQVAHKTHKKHHPMCKTCAASDAHFLKRTQLRLFLAQAFWFKTAVWDIPASSSKVNSVPGKSAILLLSFWAKLDSKTPVSPLCGIKVCNSESLKPGQDKSLSTKKFALTNNFCWSLS